MIQQEKIVVLGASQNPTRTSYMATRFLHNRGFSLYAIANRKGMIENIELHDDSELASHFEADTVTVFLHPERQKRYYDYILSLKPRRIIFNPGTENPELEQLAGHHNIQVITGCTIAMLAGGLL